MARGSIRQRGARSRQLTYDLPRGYDGKRQQRYETVQGTKTTRGPSDPNTRIPPAGPIL